MRPAVLHDEARVLNDQEFLEEAMFPIQALEEREVLAGAEDDRGLPARAELELRAERLHDEWPHRS